MLDEDLACRVTSKPSKSQATLSTFESSHLTPLSQHRRQALLAGPFLLSLGLACSRSVYIPPYDRLPRHKVAEQDGRYRRFRGRGGENRGQQLYCQRRLEREARREHSNLDSS